MLQDSVIAAGYPYRLTKENHGEAVRSLLVHEIILSRRSEIDQVIAGLGPEICTMVKEHGKVMSSLFTNEGQVPLVASEFLKLVTYENTLPPPFEGLLSAVRLRSRYVTYFLIIDATA